MANTGWRGAVCQKLGPEYVPVGVGPVAGRRTGHDLSRRRTAAAPKERKNELRGAGQAKRARAETGRAKLARICAPPLGCQALWAAGGSGREMCGWGYIDPGGDSLRSLRAVLLLFEQR